MSLNLRSLIGLPLTDDRVPTPAFVLDKTKLLANIHRAQKRAADLGVACGRGQGLLFSHGQIIGKVAEDQIVDALMAEVDKLIEEK